MAKFFTLHELINRLDFSHSSLANYIEMNGVFGCATDKEISFYDPDSLEIEQALAGVVFDLDDKKSFDRFGREWEDVADADLYRFQGQGPTHFFGWPEDKVPVPWEVSEDPDWIGSRFYKISSGIFIGDPRIYTIGRLLVTCKATAAEIATEIETTGIFGFDKVDRLCVEKIGFVGHDALDVLADWTRLVKKDPSLKSNAFDDLRLKNFGWPRGELPSFAGIPKGYGLTKEENTPVTESAEKPVSTHDQINNDLEPVEHLSSLSERQSYQAMIGSLLAYINQNGKPISEAQLLGWIDDNIKIRGVKRTNGKKLFKEGKVIIKEIRQLFADNDVTLLDPSSEKNSKRQGK